jgi:hypothetical protein
MSAGALSENLSVRLRLLASEYLKSTKRILFQPSVPRVDNLPRLGLTGEDFESSSSPLVASQTPAERSKSPVGNE